MRALPFEAGSTRSEPFEGEFPAPKSIDLRPIVRNHKNVLWGNSGVHPWNQNGTSKLLFDNLSCWFLKTLPASPLNPKTWQESPPKSLIPKDRGKEMFPRRN